jgi:hypothetical protein
MYHCSGSNIMPLFPPQGYRKTSGIIRYGLAADKPAAGDVLIGTLYFSTDTNILQRSNGVTWAHYSGVPPVGIDGTYLRSDGSVPAWSGLNIADFPEGGTWDLGGSDLTLSSMALKLSTAGKGYFERARSVAMGDWISPAYNAGDFTAGGTMTWTVQSADVYTYEYTLIGHTMILAFDIIQTSVTAPLAADLRIAIPGGFTAAKYTPQVFVYNDNGGGNTAGFAQIVPGGTYLSLYKMGLGNWSAAVNTTNVFGNISFEVG